MYFGQITDLQFADEESPARVEFLDFDPSGYGIGGVAAQEAFGGSHVADWRAVRQMNRYLSSPVPPGQRPPRPAG